jgi:transposase
MVIPPTLDELILGDHPVRFVAGIVDKLDDNLWRSMSIDPDGKPFGAPAYHPRALLSVWLYGFMTGTLSSRKLEDACRDQVPYLWLTAWQHPDHNTLWRFYKEHRGEMRHLFKLTVRTAVKMNLVDLAVQAVDGSKVQANAAKDRTYNSESLRRLLQHTDMVIQELEKQNEAGDSPPPVHLPEKLSKAQALRTKIKAAIEQLAEEDGVKRVNLTDGDAELMKSRQGIVAGYNVQTVVAPLRVTETGQAGGMLITAVDTVQDADDHRQLVNLIEQAEEITGKKADITLADAGYHSGINVAACLKRKQRIAMPEAQDNRLRPAGHSKFSYDINSDSYICPAGKTLTFIGVKLVIKKTMRVYGGLGSTCRECSAFGSCTRNRYRGRELLIGPCETALRDHRAWMTTPEAKEAYKRRKELSEPSFGIIKEQMRFRRFLLRGINNTKAEAVMVATAFNMRMLCRVCHYQLNKARQAILAAADILCRLWHFIQYDHRNSGNVVINIGLD